MPRSSEAQVAAIGAALKAASVLAPMLRPMSRPSGIPFPPEGADDTAAATKITRGEERMPSRRTLLKSAIASTLGASLPKESPCRAQTTPAAAPPNRGDTYETHAKGIRILPGQWRPHYPWEQIAWISPAWTSQDYLWLDFPEAIFSSQGLLYLSAINPKFPVVFPDLPKIRWRQIPAGLAFERKLPSGVRFGGHVVQRTERLVELELHLHNGSKAPLRQIVLQTCLYLRAIREFADFTNTNKYVHSKSSGWIPLSEALLMKETGPSPYRVGWRRDGKAVADLPVMVTVSNQPDRLVAMTWHEQTLSLIGNARHPCMHADPLFKDFEPGERATIRGHIVFFEGKLHDFDWEKETRIGRKP